MKRYDRLNNGWLSKDLFVHALDEDGITEELNDQEMLTVMRFDTVSWLHLNRVVTIITGHITVILAVISLEYSIY